MQTGEKASKVWGSVDTFNLDQALIERYESFARSFSEIRAPEIRAQVDVAYAEQRFWTEPLISINPRFEAGASVDELVARNALDPALSKIFAAGPDRTPIKLHRHQERAIAKARNGESFIVTTGTGSGKSLYFFLPIVDAVERTTPNSRSGDRSSTVGDRTHPSSPSHHAHGISVRAEELCMA